MLHMCLCVCDLIRLGGEAPSITMYIYMCTHTHTHAHTPTLPEEPSKKKRKSRWGSEDIKSVIPGLPTVLPANMTEDQQKLYISK